MKPINYAGFNTRLVGPGGENDPNIQPLPAHNDGRVTTSCWSFTDDELKEINRTGRIFLQVFAGISAPPIRPIIYDSQLSFVIANPETAYHSFYFTKESTGRGCRVYIAFDSLPPFGFVDENGDKYLLNQEGVKKNHGANYALDKGDYYFRVATPEEHKAGGDFHFVSRKEAGGRETNFRVIYSPTTPAQ